MKKIFLFTLLTCFMCVNMWGQVARITFSDDRTPVDCADEATLRSALLGLPTDGTIATITLLQNIDITGASYLYDASIDWWAGDTKVIKFPSGVNAVLNLNGKGISKTLLEDAMSGDGNIDKLCLIYNQGRLNIISEGSDILQIAVTAGPEAWGQIGNATTICNAGDLTIDGGIFIGPNAGYDLPKCPVIWAKNASSNITINGGTFLCYEGISDYNKGQDWGPLAGPGTWTIKGGIFSTDEMAGTPLLKAGGSDRTKYSTKTLFETEGKSYYGYLAEGYQAIEVPYTNANIPGYNSTLRTTESVCPDSSKMASADYYNTGDYKNKYRYFVKPVCVIVPDAAGTDNFLFVGNDATMTIKDGETLHVGDKGIVFGNANSKIIVEAGGTLLSDGEIVTSTSNNIELTMDARNNKYSVLAFNTAGSILTKHPDATVTLKSVCDYDGATYKWQRFAVPTYLNSIKKSDFIDNSGGAGHYSVVYKWDYDADDWSKLTNDNDVLLPFQCYDMTIDHAGPEDYVFRCELVGKGDPSMDLHLNWNYLANSYTAPLSLKAVLTDLYSSLDLAAGVWVQLEPGTTNWASAAYADVVFDELPIKKLNPMQAFVFYNKTAESMSLKYDDYVFKPLIGTASYAPARHRSVAEDITRAHVVIEDADGVQETVKLYLSGDFSEAEDPGFDLPKYINADKFNFYAVTDLGNLERVASNNLDEIALILETKDATSFTMKFESVSLEGYGILDKLTDTTTPIAEESEYAFTAEDNATIADRFVVVKETPTAIDNIVPAGAKNGYYSMTGVYMGEDFHALPAGMYIINGKKVVK